MKNLPLWSRARDMLPRAPRLHLRARARRFALGVAHPGYSKLNNYELNKLRREYAMTPRQQENRRVLQYSLELEQQRKARQQQQQRQKAMKTWTPEQWNRWRQTEQMWRVVQEAHERQKRQWQQQELEKLRKRQQRQQPLTNRAKQLLALLKRRRPQRALTATRR